MKKPTQKQRDRNVKLNIRLRRNIHKRRRISTSKRWFRTGTQPTNKINKWINDKIKEKLLAATIDKKKRLTIVLPESMNFNNNYEETSVYINAIRKVTNRPAQHNTYRLNSVSFNNLKNISTSAALVLTAELSKWDDAIRQNLAPNVANWDSDILRRFRELGFFSLFRKSPEELCNSHKTGEADINFVRYIKGKCGDANKTRILKREIIEVVGEDICKWTFLHSGLTEAITNVSHHAYPDGYEFIDSDKNWYMSGGYDRKTNELKVVFYDQGIGIPKSLPASTLKEKVFELISNLDIDAADRMKDATLLKAAVQLSRTSTGRLDRGKGLQDLLEFIKQRGNGYLSILSLRGLYKFTVSHGVEITKSEHFNNAIPGTLIIWSATLNDKYC